MKIFRKNGAATVREYVNPVVIAGIFRIAIQITEVLHRHECAEEEPVKYDLLLDEGAQRLIWY